MTEERPGERRGREIEKGRVRSVEEDGKGRVELLNKGKRVSKG